MQDTITPEYDTGQNPRPKRHWPRWLLTGIGLLTALFIGVGIANSGNHTTMTPASASSSAPASPVPSTTAPGTSTAPPSDTSGNYNADIGSTLNVQSDTDHWTVTVNSVKPYSPGEFDSAAGAGYHYVVANVTYKTITGKASPNPWDWKSKEDNGQTHDVEYLGDGTMLSSDNLEAGQKTTGDVYFKIPDSGRSTLVYSAGLSESGSWAITGDSATSSSIQSARSSVPVKSASATVREYFRLLNARDFQGAWNVGGSSLAGGTGYSQWVSGYDHTTSTDVSIAGTSGDSVEAYLISHQDNGKVKTYTGTYNVSGGKLLSASIHQTN